MVPGNGEGRGGGWPGQGATKNKNETVTTVHAKQPKRKLPMHPLVATRLHRWANRSMEWKTFSVEAGDGFSKQASRTHERQSRAFPNPAKLFPLDGSVFDIGMPDDGLPMFRYSCYS